MTCLCTPKRSHDNNCMQILKIWMSNIINCKNWLSQRIKIAFQCIYNCTVISPLGWNLRFKFLTEKKLSSSHVTYIFPVKYSSKKNSFKPLGMKGFATVLIFLENPFTKLQTVSKIQLKNSKFLLQSRMTPLIQDICWASFRSHAHSVSR